jgi:hypothetical protein
VKKSNKVIILWGSILMVYLTALFVLPHSQIAFASVVNRSIQTLLFSISLFIFLNEPIKQNKLIFLNFIICFAICSMQLLLEFFGSTFLMGNKYANFLFNQYNIIAIVLSLSVAVVYLVIDLMFRQFKAYIKYSITLAIVFLFFFYYFHPFFSNPLYLYSTEEIKQWKTLDSYVYSPERNSNKEIPTAIEISSEIKLQSWRDGVAVGDLYPEENIKRIEELTPYLSGENWQVLFFKPLYLNIIHMNVLLIGFIVLFFGYQYKKDPPQGAYIDKIMFMFLLFCSMEILHNWGFIKSLEWTSYNQMVTVGQYITVFIELLMVLFFGLRLRFITSVQGEFYETELATNPQRVTRWRDWVDEIVLSQFFNFKLFNGRLFQDPSAK